MMCEICSQLPDEIPGKTVSDIPALSERLDKLSIDAMAWITHYRCKYCGQYWEERYEAKGHGEVPSLFKIKK